MTPAPGAPPEGPNRLEIAALIAAVAWMALGALRLWLLPTGLGTAAVVAEVVGAALPVVLLGALVAARRRISTLEAELAAAQRGLRVAGQGGQGATGVVMVSAGAPQATASAPQAKQAGQGAARAARTGPGAPVAAPAPPAPQQEFDLEPASPEAPLTRADALRALDFPISAADIAGRAALHRGLADPWFARVLRAGQDILLLLAQEGLVAETLPQASADASLWTRFAGGERGAALAGLCPAGHDLVAPLAARLRRDDVFRDTAHHFVRRFDEFLGAFIQDANADEIAQLMQTRSARAFALLIGAFGALG